ncbi:hypothetical protein HYY74_05330 [Candidatus Woesearchaeota archaeon]|nr:hypothetical protein [Candidatus Woesearchaeota archaeon]
MPQVTLETIHKDLELIKNEIKHIRGQIADVDAVLTDDDMESLNEAEDDLRKGRTKKLA